MVSWVDNIDAYVLTVDCWLLTVSEAKKWHQAFPSALMPWIYWSGVIYSYSRLTETYQRLRKVWLTSHTIERPLGTTLSYMGDSMLIKFRGWMSTRCIHSLFCPKPHSCTMITETLQRWKKYLPSHIIDARPLPLWAVLRLYGCMCMLVSFWSWAGSKLFHYYVKPFLMRLTWDHLVLPTAERDLVEVLHEKSMITFP